MNMEPAAVPVSRAMNLALGEGEVRERCLAWNISISAIEPLQRGGTHLVCKTIEGADEVRRKLGKHLVFGTVRRFPFYRSRGPW